MSYIDFENVRKVYKSGEVEIEAIHDVSFSIEKGELCVIVGPSGAGKTTLLNILGGMDTLTSGRILLDGENISALPKKRLVGYRRQDVGFVFQFYNLIENLTALENVQLAAQGGARIVGAVVVDACQGRTRGTHEEFPFPAFRRGAAARGDRPRACQEPQTAALR